MKNSCIIHFKDKETTAMLGMIDQPGSVHVAMKDKEKITAYKRHYVCDLREPGNINVLHLAIVE